MKTTPLSSEELRRAADVFVADAIAVAAGAPILAFDFRRSQQSVTVWTWEKTLNRNAKKRLPIPMRKP